ncbi:TIGR01777 family oxidoreductase [Pedobacter cryotolerans]|uniref:TIGR01777 family protein n=1 Tax=Pedobacter cryotolerans TaxID=2571270 RepID=A0A4U1C576_9SPHI|nr:TIGR01777 family oxidoreductase [Pedobacter cryotolerans]TKB99610.1 TIGR01777 family protein [Pedobacter cryotolerans]
MPQKILITGATGLVGSKLIPALQRLGHEINILSRNDNQIKGVKTFIWDVYAQKIDKGCLIGVDTIIHLAGEGIADKRWTAERKQQIIDSRVLSTQLLYQTIKETNSSVKSFVSASAVGFYGDRGDEILTEESASGTDFLSECCVNWENAVDEGLKMDIRVAKIRIGLILSKEGGALAAMEKPIQFFVGAPLGSGKQWMPWIHLDDILGIFIKAVEDQNMIGAYNACAPFPVTNKFLTKSIAKQLNRPVWPVNVPKFALNALLGEMSILPLMSNNTLSKKILNSGYKFAYTNLDDALAAIYTPNP